MGERLDILIASVDCDDVDERAKRYVARVDLAPEPAAA